MKISDTGYIPEPTIILLGCQPWTAIPAWPGRCPVCGPGIKPGHDTAYCAKCDSLSPRRERQVKAARAGLKARDKTEAAEAKAKADLRKMPALTESERRRLWMGYGRTGIDSQNRDIANRSKIGREWLREIGQEPNWDLVLDKHGKVIGRVDSEPA